jgi:non-specific serine/threonine protein kinase
MQLATGNEVVTGPGVDRSPAYHDILERALVACLAAFAELAGASGQSERAFRFRDAVNVLRDKRTPDLAPLTSRIRSVSELDEGVRGQPKDTPASGSRTRCPLSSREVEVAGLVAQGLTNRQIAAQLVISERTADTHVQNILNKLGAASRAQIAIWFMEYALALSSRA